MKKLLPIVALLFFSLISYCQTLSPSEKASTTPDFSWHPKVKIGAASMVYFGDLFRYKDASPVFGNWGFNLGIGAEVTPFLDALLTVNYGWLSHHEFGQNRNANFKTTLFTTGIEFTYNFDNLLKEDPKLHPLFILGFENVEFNSKIDLNSDFHYDTDLRNLNRTQGRYALNAFSIPVGIGAEIELPNGFDVVITSTMHFTFTDYLDGLSERGEEPLKGDAGNDRFLYTGISLTYTLDKSNFNKNDVYADADFGDLDDEDGDKIIDLYDDCPHTPQGVEVESNGCPLDKDRDGVPDYRDDEMESLSGAIVNENGVAYTDEDFYRMYLDYLDSSSYSGKTVKTVYVSAESSKRIVIRPYEDKNKIYSVQVAANTEQLSTQQIAGILSIPNVEIFQEGDSTYYLVGSYDKIEPAVQQKIALENEGVDGIVISIVEGKRTYEKNLAETTEKEIRGGMEENTAQVAISSEVVYRVQIGAFAYPLSRNIFKDVNDLISLSGEDGLVRYMTGSFPDIESAAARKIDVLLNGFEGAFIVAYKSGRRISLEEAGNTTVPVDLVAADQLDLSKLRFKVQIGAFKDHISPDLMDIYLGMGDVKAYKQEGITRYLSGDFGSEEEARNHLQRLKNRGIEDAFVVGSFNERIISVDEANQLLGSP